MKKTSLVALLLVFIFTGVCAAADTLQLDVKKAVQLTLQNNPQLQQILAKQRQAAAGVGQAEAGNWPTVTLQDSFMPLGYDSITYSGFPNDGIHPQSLTLSGSSGVTNGLNVTVNYPLFAGGSITYGIAQAKSYLQMADWGVQLTKQELQNGATQYYYLALYEKNMVVVKQSALDTANEHLRVVNAQYNAGVVAKTDVLRTQVEVANAQEGLISEQNNYALALLQLKSFMNIPLDTTIVLTEQLSYQDKPLDINSLVNYALANRPDYINTQLQISADNSALNVSKAGYYPTVALQATYSNALGFNQKIKDPTGGKEILTLNNNSNEATLGAVLQYNVFSGFLTTNQVKAAQAQIDQDTQAQIQSRLNVIYQVNQSVNNIVTDMKVIAVTKANLDFATENYKINLVQYAAGVTTNLNVMDAQSQLTKAQTDYWGSLYTFNRDNATLQLNIGTPVQ